ncbi:MAG: putative glycolipid-binding domain-containing protein [Ktedonobacterales bacterium]|nr:putative glycolipid-binding domain-containing protein [Ktedonobacterales bacterium]
MRTAILWHLTAPFSTERCVIATHGETLRFTGTVVHVADGHPSHTSYTVTLDPQWRTRAVDIHSAALQGERSLHLTADGQGNWWRDEAQYPALDGCIDIDLGITPATNTLPIRRLGLHVGQSADVEAAWVRFPALTIERLPQRYTRLTADRYRYESPDFAATLDVDEKGLVRAYEGLWQAIAVEEG